MMDPLKNIIFSEIRKKNEEFINCSYDELNALVFRQDESYRLLLSGFILVKKIFTAYSFEIPCTIKAKHYMGLSKMKYPYFLTAKRLVLFSEMDAMVINLQGGIDKFLENCLNIEE